MSTRSLSILGFILLASACKDKVWTELNTDHCANNEGDRYCADRFPDRPYCEQGEGECALGDQYGCLAEVPAACHMPCGLLNEDECVGVESSGTATAATTASSSGSESGSVGESSSTGPMPCVSDEECTSADAPFCGASGECGTCSSTTDPDAACAGVDPGLPLCVGDTCVACTLENPVVCDEQLLLCDGGTNACVPCTEHGQCGSGACELAVGTCFPAGAVVHVDGDAGAMPVPDFMSVAAAVASIGDGTHGVIVVHELDGGASYQAAGGVTIDGDKRIALLAAPGEAPILLGTMGNPGLAVDGAGTILYMDGLSVSGNTGGVGLRVNDAFAWVDRSRIVQNTGGGVLAENAAELTLRNCFVGGDIPDTHAVVVNGATANILYTTAGGSFGDATGLTCDLLATVTVRNSLFVARTDTDEVLCDATIDYSAAELDLGGNNVALGDMATAWFTAYGTGGFGLTPMHPVSIDTTALWSTGDPLTDIDGDPRPAIDGTADYAGADVPQ